MSENFVGFDQPKARIYYKKITFAVDCKIKMQVLSLFFWRIKEPFSVIRLLIILRVCWIVILKCNARIRSLCICSSFSSEMTDSQNSQDGDSIKPDIPTKKPSQRNPNSDWKVGSFYDCIKHLSCDLRLRLTLVT